jgi:hypothetical protein
MVKVRGHNYIKLVVCGEEEECGVHSEDTRPDDSPIGAQELAEVNAWAEEVKFEEFVTNTDLTDGDIESWLATAPGVSVNAALHERMRIAARRALVPELRIEEAATPSEVVLRLMMASSTSTADAAKLLRIATGALEARLREPLALLDPAMAPRLGDLARHVGVSLRSLLVSLAVATRRHLSAQAELRLSAAPLSRLDARSRVAPTNDPNALVRAVLEKDIARARQFFVAAVTVARRQTPTSQP